jgi:hypothetical protein
MNSVELIKYVQKARGRARPRVHWCPIGEMAFLPIHAAGVYTGGAPECCSDYVVSSYTPTLSALKRARDGLTSRPCASLTVLAAAADTSPGMPPLSNVKGEVKDVVNLAQQTNHINTIEYGLDAMVSVREVAEALPRADIVHLACHGVQNREDPLESGFCLGDGRLSVSELMNIKLDRAILAFLSACETAKGDEAQPDQTIHLAAAMLFCGFRSVIGTMWCAWPGSEVSALIHKALGLWVMRTDQKLRRGCTRRCLLRRPLTPTPFHTRWTRPSRACESEACHLRAGPPSSISGHSKDSRINESGITLHSVGMTSA